MRKSIRIFSVLLALIMLLSTAVGVVSAANDQKRTSNRFNVVFVIDASGSMEDTDPQKLRFDATTLFLSLLANSGNRVGSVVFATGVKQVTDLRDINGVDDKLFIEGEIEKCPAEGWTAIGDALKTATDMLEKQGNPDNKSVIILLSDGYSELGSDDALKKCNDNKAEAIQDARDRGVAIYSVGLNVNNVNGDKGIKELKQISGPTGGECEEVNKPEDLKKIFQLFYTLIYGSAPVPIGEYEVPSDGNIEKTFLVPSAGVEEVNIIISSKSKISDMTLEMPDGTVWDVNKVKGMTVSTNSFAITKLVDPMGGEWTLRAKGTPNDKVKIEMIFNDNLSVETECDTAQAKAGSKLPVFGYLLENNQRATDGYADYHATLHVTFNKSADEKPRNLEFDMDPQSSSYYYELPIDEIGHYELYMSLTGNGTNKDTSDNMIRFDVGNTSPAIGDGDKRLKDGRIEETIWFIPFLTKTHEIPVGGIITDPEDGDDLTYSVSSSSFNDTTYEIDSNEKVLIIKDFLDLSKGSVTIRATDAMGAYAEFDVLVTIVNVGVIAIIVIVAAAVIVAGIIVLLIYLLSRKKFMGTITVRNLETNAVMTQQKNKGHINLTAFQIGHTGFHKKACFQATGKSWIEFRSPTPVLSSSSVSKEKKIKILNRSEIEIYSDDSRTRGIAVTFESYLGGY